MALNFKAKGGGGDFKGIPAGSHIAVCNLVAFLGLQPGSGMFPEPKLQLYIRFEVPSERVSYEKDGRKLEGPRVIGKTYTASMHEKANLRRDLETWRGRQFSDEEAESFDVESILGKACMLSVVEKVKGDKTYSNIASISGLPKGVPAPKAENTLLLYTEFNRDTFKQLPEWLQEKITGQLEVKSQKQEEESNDGYPGYSDDDILRSTEITDDDIPF